MPTLDSVSEEDEEEKLSKIIERLNSTYGVNLDPKVAGKGVEQIIAKAEQDEELRRIAEANDFRNFALPFDDAATKRLIVESYEQSEDFYNMLLNNDEARRTVLNAIARNVYEKLRRAGDSHAEDEYEYAEAASKGDSQEKAGDGYDASK